MRGRYEPNTTNMKSRGLPAYIAVEGPIGVGKSTLVKRMCQSLGADAVLEQAEDNPFLPRFYLDPTEAALPAQLSFLFQRARALETLVQRDLFRPARVADFILEKDLLFAEITLNDDELALYHEVYRRVVPKVPAPDLVIYLQAGPDVLFKRIMERGRSYERGIRRDYLSKVIDAYARFFHHYDRSRVLIVNSEHIDLVTSDLHYERLLDEMAGSWGQRSYFNPEAR